MACTMNDTIGIQAMAHKFNKSVYIVFLLFCAVLLALVIFLNLKAQRDSRHLLEESVRSQLTTVCIAARRVIDVSEFVKLDSEADARNNPNYVATLEQLRHLAAASGVKYIYVLRKIDGKCLFIYDTDEENTEVFIEYPASRVHEEAFAGHDSAGISNVRDEFGSFSTGAVPIWRGGQVVGVVAADIEDTLLADNSAVGLRNIALLAGAVALAMLIMALIMHYLLRRIRRMQDELTRLAHFDVVTGLPNRQYLLEFLNDLGQRDGKTPFALYFIDLDNFKRVNDVAGHDAGDALLKRIGRYLERSRNDTRISRVFRPGAGRLNVAARIGGDEFVIVVPNIGNAADAGDVAQRLLDGFRREAIDDHIAKFGVGMSIGIALYPRQSEDYNVLIKYADIAMYHAKNAGKNCYRVYDDELTDKPEK